MLVGWLARIAKAFGGNRGDGEKHVEAEAAGGRSLLGSMIGGLVPALARTPSDREKEQTMQSLVPMFLAVFRETIEAENGLYISASGFALLPDPEPFWDTVSDPDMRDMIADQAQFEMIVGDFPLGLRSEPLDPENPGLRFRASWNQIARSLPCLTSTGYGLFLIEPTAFSSSDGVRFEDYINSRGFFLNALFECPVETLHPHTTIVPLLAAISRRENEQMFIGGLRSEAQIEILLSNFQQNISANDLAGGALIPSRSFRSFSHFRNLKQIDQLETQFKNYKTFSLRDLATEIRALRSGQQHTAKDNAVYIPKVGNSPAIYDLRHAKIKHHNYFQVVLSSLAVSGYVASFLNSSLGRLVRDALKVGSTIPQLRKSELGDMLIALPSVEEQTEIFSTYEKLDSLGNAIEQLNQELALNPTSSLAVLTQIDEMLSVIGALSDSDRIKALIREGESKTIEFKETFSLDVNKGSKAAYLEKTALKTIVAFLNTEGGDLLIGVADNKDIRGIDREIEKLHKSTDDKYLLHFKNKLKSTIGEQYYPLVDYNIAIVEGRRLLWVKCRKSDTPCYFEGNEFFVRINPATDKLEGHKLVEYVKRHFDS